MEEVEFPNSSLNERIFGMNKEWDLKLEVDNNLDRCDLHVFTAQVNLDLERPSVVATIRNRLSHDGWASLSCSERNTELYNLGFAYQSGVYNRVIQDNWVEIGTVPSHGNRPSLPFLLPFAEQILESYRVQFPSVEELIVSYPYDWLTKHEDDTHPYAHHIDFEKNPGRENPAFFEAFDRCEVDTAPEPCNG